MHTSLLVLACLAFAGHGRRARTVEPTQGTTDAQRKQIQEVKPLASLLATLLDPAAGWKVGAVGQDYGHSRNIARARSKHLPASLHCASSLSTPNTRTQYDEDRLLIGKPPVPRNSKILMPSPAYRVPETTRDEWVRHHSPLYKERIAHLGQEIDDYVINQIISSFLFCDAEDPKSPQYLYINSPGGSVIAGLALYDAMQHISSPVITANLGMAASMASFLLGAGVRGKRIGLPDTWVMIHQPMAGIEGQATDKRVEAEQVYRIKETILTMYAQMTGRTRDEMILDLSFDNYMRSEQAVEYGLIDKIAGV